MGGADVGLDGERGAGGVVDGDGRGGVSGNQCGAGVRRRCRLAQAKEIVRAEQAVPGSEVALLVAAATSGMAGLRESARRVVLGSMDRDRLHAEQHRARSVQHWVDDLGMVTGRFRLPPEVGVPFVNRLDVETDRVRRAARRDGSAEAREAHAADAFVAMTSGPAGRPAGGPTSCSCAT